MIGNDLVEFYTAALQSNWQRRGFLEKLFSETEQSLILNSEFPQQKLWLLWAMKEASYKAHQRRFNLPRSFNPRQFTCEIIQIENNSVSGKVKIQDFSYHTQSDLGEKYLHCIATLFRQQKIVQKISSNSTQLKLEFILAVSAFKKIEIEKIHLKKGPDFIPYLSSDGLAIDCDFSLSHHGNFSAFVLSLTPC